MALSIGLNLSLLALYREKARTSIIHFLSSAEVYRHSLYHSTSVPGVFMCVLVRNWPLISEQSSACAVLNRHKHFRLFSLSKPATYNKHCTVSFYFIFYYCSAEVMICEFCDLLCYEHETWTSPLILCSIRSQQKSALSLTVLWLQTLQQHREK